MISVQSSCGKPCESLTGIHSLVLAAEVAAILASGVIVGTALGLIRPAVSDLLDAASQEMIGVVTELARGVEGIQLVEKVWVRKSGSGFYVDMHLLVRNASTVCSGSKS